MPPPPELRYSFATSDEVGRSPCSVAMLRPPLRETRATPAVTRRVVAGATASARTRHRDAQRARMECSSRWAAPASRHEPFATHGAASCDRAQPDAEEAIVASLPRWYVRLANGTDH